MSKIQTVVSSEIEQEINNIVQQKKMEGANYFEANVSNVASMLIEIGLKQYHQERGRGGNKFDQDKYNKCLLEHVISTSLIMQHLLSHQSSGSPVIDGDDPRPIGSIINSRVKETVREIFPLTECELVDKALRELS